jgi:uncharacterized protein (DUF1810 family)
MTDETGLARFHQAQAPLYDTILAELSAGRKRTHWMWFGFPQLRGLGHSAMAERYGIASLSEAHAYLADAILGPRLIACAQAVLAHPARTLAEIFGTPDDMKFISSMTLFAIASGSVEGVFQTALARYNSGRSDERTVALLAMQER